MDRRTVLKGGLVLAATAHTAAGVAAISDAETAIQKVERLGIELAEALAETGAELRKEHVRTLSYLISDMIEGVPGYDYVIIQPASAGKWAVGVQSKVHVEA